MLNSGQTDLKLKIETGLFFKKSFFCLTHSPQTGLICTTNLFEDLYLSHRQTYRVKHAFELEGSHKHPLKQTFIFIYCPTAPKHLPLVAQTISARVFLPHQELLKLNEL